MEKFRITVCTPTFNRAYILDKLYNSLLFQSFKNFEWLIVDDGSTDNTESIVKEWINKNNICIRYYKKENGGKHTAINYGLDLALGELFFTVDSDDYLTNDALEKIDLWFKDINKSNNICGIVANKGTSSKKTNNNCFSKPYIDIPLSALNSYLDDENIVINGERAIVFYTDFHKKYRFPVFDNEFFMPEAIVYNRMAIDGYLCRFFNDIIEIIEYRDDGLTRVGDILYINNPKGYWLWIKEEIVLKKIKGISKIKIHYQFICDLLQKYSISHVKDIIDMSNFEINIIYVLHTTLKRIRGKKNEYKKEKF